MNRVALSDLAAVWVVCDECRQQLDGALYCIYRFVHQSPHSQLHHLTVLRQGQCLNKDWKYFHVVHLIRCI